MLNSFSFFFFLKKIELISINSHFNAYPKIRKEMYENENREKHPKK